jgi:Fe-S cluster assembly ATPase SufC
MSHPPIDEPTVGVDVGAKEYIHDLIYRMANEEGRGVILIAFTSLRIGQFRPGSAVRVHVPFKRAARAGLP